MFEDKWLLPNRGFGWKNKIIITCQLLISMRHQSNGLGYRTVKQFKIFFCVLHVTETRILEKIYNFVLFSTFVLVFLIFRV